MIFLNTRSNQNSPYQIWWFIWIRVFLSRAFSWCYIEIEGGSSSFTIAWLNQLTRFGDSLWPWSSLLDDKFWSLDIEDSFAIGVIGACAKGITNQKIILVSCLFFYSSYERRSFILSSIKQELVAIRFCSLIYLKYR